MTTNSFTRQVAIFHKHHTRQYLAVVIVWMMSLVDWKHFAEDSRELSVPELQGYHAWSDSYVIAFRTRKPYTIIMGIINLKKGVVNTGSMTPIFTQRNHDLFVIRILATFIACSLSYFARSEAFRLDLRHDLKKGRGGGLDKLIKNRSKLLPI